MLLLLQCFGHCSLLGEATKLSPNVPFKRSWSPHTQGRAEEPFHVNKSRLLGRAGIRSQGIKTWLQSGFLHLSGDPFIQRGVHHLWETRGGGVSVAVELLMLHREHSETHTHSQ